MSCQKSPSRKASRAFASARWTASRGIAASRRSSPASLRDAVVTSVERDLLLRSLHKAGGNKMRAAKLLNMKRTTFVEKLKRLQIET